jgi:hypothetical protein
MKDHNAHMAVKPTTGKGAPKASAPTIKTKQGVGVASNANSGMKKQLHNCASTKVKKYY